MTSFDDAGGTWGKDIDLALPSWLPGFTRKPKVEKLMGILIFFTEDQPHFLFIASSDRETEALQRWLESNFSGRPKGLSGEALTLPGPASLSGGDKSGKSPS